jgi:hypothetical protein
VTTARLELTRDQVLAHRRHVGALDERLPPGPDALRRAAWAGLQDSMPRAALLSIHARVEATTESILDDQSLVQLWGPRFSAYVVAGRDRALFTLGRLPDGGARRHFADEMAARLYAFLGDRRMTYGEAGRALGVHPNALRYAAPTGTLLMSWDGARQPTIWTVTPPDVTPGEARLELARRYLHVFGPGTAESFAKWAGVTGPTGRDTFATLKPSLTAVRTAAGEGWILAGDEPASRATPRPAAPARLLPSGDAYFLLHGADRELLVPDADRRAALWTSRVWPGALLVDGEINGTWRRANEVVTIQPWRRLARAARAAVEAEAASLPLPGIAGHIDVRWLS